MGHGKAEEYDGEREWQNKVAYLMVARKQRSKQIIRTRSKLLFRSLPRDLLPTAVKWHGAIGNKKIRQTSLV